jgi:hypothetical protein
MQNWSVWKTVVLSVLLLTLAACAGSAQVAEDDRAALARTLAGVFVDGGSYARILDEGAELAESYSVDAIEFELGRTVSDDERARVRQILHDVLAEFLTQTRMEQILTDVCERNFTAAQLDATINYFRSPAGVRFLEIEATLAREIDEQVMALLGADEDAFVGRVDQALAVEFPGLDDEAVP